MEPVVTSRIFEEGDFILLSLLVLTGVITGSCGFLLGWLCFRAPSSIAGPTGNPLGRWPRLATKALRFIHRRRLVALAFSNYRDSTLRNSVNSQPNTARRQIHQRAQTPRPGTGVLNEGPALRRRHGPHGSGAGSN